MQHEAILYSIDPTITKEQLQNKEHIFYNKKKYTKLQKWTEEEHV